MRLVEGIKKLWVRALLDGKTNKNLLANIGIDSVKMSVISMMCNRCKK